MTSSIWPFLKRDLQNEISYRLSFYLRLFGIFPTLFLFFFLSRLFSGFISSPLTPYGGGYFPFVLIGVALQSYMTLALGGFASGLREAQLSGTLESIFAAPVEPLQFLAGSAAYNFVFNSLRIFLYFAAGVVLFGVHFELVQGPLAVLTIVLTIGAFSVLGIGSAGFIILFKRGDPVNYAVQVFSALLGGVYFPISILPDWVQKISAFIPMTHSLEALRLSLLKGEGLASTGGSLLALAIWTALGLPLSYGFFRWALHRARERGTLGHY